MSSRKSAPAAPAARKRPAQRRRAPAETLAPTLVALDSSCWLEFFADTPRADLYAQALQEPARLVVPVLTVYEVHKKLLREAGEDVASMALSLMQQGQVVPIDLQLAISASAPPLPLADSLIYAAARAHGAELWTQDAHFKGLPGVRYFEKHA